MSSLIFHIHFSEVNTPQVLLFHSTLPLAASLFLVLSLPAPSIYLSIHPGFYYFFHKDCKTAEHFRAANGF